MSERFDDEMGVLQLLEQSRARELARIEMLLGIAGNDATDGLRIARLTADVGVGSTTLLDLLARRRPDATRVHRIDARRGAQSLDAAAIAHDLPPDARALVLVDHAWESDLLAAALGAFVDQLDPAANVSVLLVEHARHGAPAAAWQFVLDELAERTPMPAVQLGPPPAADLDAVLARTHPTLPDALRARVLELSGAVPRVAMLLAESGGRVADSIAQWVEQGIDGLDAATREGLILLAHVEEGLHETALGGDLTGAPFATRDEDGAWRVEPAAVREALRADAGAAHVRACIAEAIERTEQSSDAVDRADRARLLEARGDGMAARTLWRAIATEHEQAGRLVEAGIARRYEVAASTDTAHLLESLHAAARTFREHGVQSASEHALMQLRRVAGRAGDEELGAWALRELAFTRGDVTMLESPELQSSDAGWAWEARAAAADNAADYERVLAYGQLALERAVSNGDELLELRARDLLASAAVDFPAGHPLRREPQAAVAELAEIINRSWAAGHRHRALLAAHTEAYVTRLTGRFDQSASRLEAHIERARAAGRPNHVVSLGAYLVEALTQGARLTEAEQLCRTLRAEQDARYVDRYDEAFLRIAELMVHVERHIDEALRERLSELEQQGLLELHVTLRVAWCMVGLRAAVALGDTAGMSAAAAELLELETPADDLAAAAADLARAGVDGGGDEHVLAWARRLLAGVSVEDDLPLVATCRAEAQACLDQDVAALTTVVERWHALGCELRALRVELACCQAAESPDAEQLRSLKSRLRAAGMRDAEDAVNVLLRASGHAARATATPRGDAPLTEREEQVARLVVTGLTNREVAERLGVRPATIARILANVYERHSLAGRTSLVSFLAALDEQR